MSPNDGRCDVGCPVELPGANDVGDEDGAPPDVDDRSDGGAMRPLPPMASPPPRPPVDCTASSWRLSRNLARNVAALSGPATVGDKEASSCVVAVAVSSIEEEDAATGTGSRKKRGLAVTEPELVAATAVAAVADEAAPATVDVGVVDRNRTPNFCAAATP